MIGTVAFRVNIQGQFPLPFPLGLNEPIHVPLAGQKKLQEADPFIPAGLVDAEKDQVIT